MACDVDELDINPFFRALQTQYEEIYRNAQEKCYTICIPQTSTIQGTDISKDFVENHILKPSPYFKGELITIHSSKSKTVKLSEDGCTMSTGEGFQSRIRIKIINEELAYNKDHEKYKILITDQPLDPKFQKVSKDNAADLQITPQQCVTLEECLRFLQSFDSFSKALEKLDQGIKLFHSYMVLPDYLHDAAARLASISSEAIEIFLRNTSQRATGFAWKETLISAVESYMMNAVHCKILDVVTQHYREADECIERKCQKQLRNICLESLGIQKQFICALPKAVEHLNKMDSLTTPREKMYCLKFVIDAMVDGIETHLTQNVTPCLGPAVERPCLTSDDLIPIMVSIIGQSACTHLQSDIIYMENFTWASSAKDDLSYCLVTFKAAVMYILETDFSHHPQKSSFKKQNSSGRLSPALKQPTVNNGCCKEDNPLNTHSSHLPTNQGSERVERQRPKIFSKGWSLPDQQTERNEPVVRSIFGAQYDIPTTVEAATETNNEELGDFLSALKDDFNQPYGKLN